MASIFFVTTVFYIWSQLSFVRGCSPSRDDPHLDSTSVPTLGIAIGVLLSSIPRPKAKPAGRQSDGQLAVGADTTLTPPELSSLPNLHSGFFVDDLYVILALWLEFVLGPWFVVREELSEEVLSCAYPI